MDEQKRQALEAAGFRVGDVTELLDLTEEERRLVESRAAAGKAVAQDKPSSRGSDESPA